MSNTIAYFSMEIGLAPELRSYSGGLGVLAGDTIRAAADRGLPMVAVTLLHKHGYFRQTIDEDGWQHEESDPWDVEAELTPIVPRANVTIEGREVLIRAWRFTVHGIRGHTVAIYFLDADLDENEPADRELTHKLYGGDESYRLAQEIILGIGGIRMLDVMGLRPRDRYHMNEGHSALLTFELLQRHIAGRGGDRVEPQDIKAVQQRCVFTTHTPVPAGHDKFSMDLARKLIGNHPALDRADLICSEERLNLTYVALNLSRYINGVAQRHGEVSRRMFAGYEIDAITNGVHAGTWVSPTFQALFDRHITAWREDASGLRFASGIPSNEVAEAHRESKRALLDEIRAQTDVTFNEDVFTIGFARRATPYKRWDLLFRDTDRLRRIAEQVGPMQLVFSGKAHPRDEGGKHLIQRVIRTMRELGEHLRGVFLPGYDMRLGGLLTAGVDLWLNTPQPPMEASGTSGMKAALNGVPSLSTLDGWWIEGCYDGVTGWSIGEDHAAQPDHEEDTSESDAASLYDRLEHDILPLFYQNHDRYLAVRTAAIALNGSFFNTQRMIDQYARNAYR